MDIKDLTTKLARVGLQERKPQLEMIETTYQAIKDKRIFCIEAPTGTGKTISYLLASVLAKKAKEPIVISTATIALQEQLFNQDLPLLCKILKQQISFALAKGRRRYVCHAKLYQNDPQGDLLSGASDATTLKKLKSQLESRQWRGDRDELDFMVDDSTWQKVSTDAQGCSGKHCEFFEECAFYAARKQIHSSDIVVTNHSLLLCDLELGGGAILPDIDKSTYIIDECHHLPEKALSHFAKSAVVMGSVDWINSLTRALTRAEQEQDINEHEKEQCSELTHSLVEQLKRMHDFFTLNEDRFSDDDSWQIPEPDITLLEIAGALLSAARAVYAQVSGLVEYFEEQLNQTQSDPARTQALASRISTFGFIESRAENLMATWDLFCHERKKGEAPIARWISKQFDQFVCHTSPINVSKNLTQLFWNKLKNSVVLCSATIRALGSFDDFQRKTGLKEHPKFIAKAIDPFFDYSRSILYVPTMQAAPMGMDQSAHRLEVLTLLPNIILEKGGTLVLFTARSAMEYTFDRLPSKLQNDTLMQGNRSKAKLIAKHKDRIRAGRRSILFGLASFGEGLDLPADYCEHVIIHKLPFSVPSTPIEKTRNDWLIANKLNPFMLSTLPATSIRLTQFVGRLIRQETDHGIVTILDKRLYTKPYGKKLLANLPAFTQVINQPVTALDAYKNEREMV